MNTDNTSIESKKWWSNLSDEDKYKYAHNSGIDVQPFVSEKQQLSIWIKEVVKNWWYDLKFSEKMHVLNRNGYPNTRKAADITDEELSTYYLQEHKEKEETLSSKWWFSLDKEDQKIFCNHVFKDTSKNEQQLEYWEIDKIYNRFHCQIPEEERVVPETVEIWVNSIDYPNYQISSLGNVRRIGSVKLLKPNLGVWGYYRVNLSHGGKTKLVSIHKLVALSFLPPIEGKTIINHINGNKIDNKVTNLEWTTHEENINHAYVTGLNTPRSGDKHSRVKLLDAHVKEATKLREEGYSCNHIKKLFKDKYNLEISRQSISAITLGRRSNNRTKCMSLQREIISNDFLIKKLSEALQKIVSELEGIMGMELETKAETTCLKIAKEALKEN